MDITNSESGCCQAVDGNFVDDDDDDEDGDNDGEGRKTEEERVA